MKDSRILDGPIGKTLYTMTVPMLFGSLAIVLFNLTDTFFVAQLGTIELAAIGFTFPVVLIVGSFTTGLGSGAASVIAQAIGKGDPDEVQRLTVHSLMLGLIFVGALVAIGMSTIDPLFRMLGAGDDTLPLIRDYMSYWYPGMLFLIIPMVGNNAIRATGDTKIPSYIMINSSIINVILDPLLIFGVGPFPQLGIAGAAIGTVVSRAISFGLTLYVLSARKKMLDFRAFHLSRFVVSARRILGIGLPAAASQLLSPLGMAIFTRLVSDFGHENVAGVAAAIRVEGIVNVPLMSLAMVLMPFIGQNWGAGKFNRASQAVDKSNLFSMFWGLGVFLVLLLLAYPTAMLFSEDPVVIDSMVSYLHIISLGYAAQGATVLVGTAFNATNQPLKSTTVTSIRMLVLFVPLAWAGGQLFGYTGLLYGAMLANILAGVIAVFWQRSVFKVHRIAPDKVPIAAELAPSPPEL